MAKPDLPFNPAVMRWARERVGLSVEAAAQKIQVRADRIRDWETGERKPTVRQARDLAKEYGRPFLEFFAAEEPQLPNVDLVPDFRLHRKPPSDSEKFALVEIQRWAEDMRLNALDLFDMNDADVPNFPADLFSQLSDNPEVKAAEARRVMGFDLEEQIALLANEERTLPALLRRRFEAFGVMVLRQNGITSLRARGMCVFAETLPVVVFGKEPPTAQAFTLLHELAHVMLKSSGISGAPRFGGKNPSHMKRVEGWCNQFAAAFLVPETALAEQYQRPEAPLEFFDDHLLRQLSRYFSISRHAMLIRLVHLRYVAPTFYWTQKREQFLQEESEFSAGGRAAYYGTRYLNSRGHLFTSLVLQAWESGGITNHNAAEFMGIKNLRHLNDIRDNFVGAV